MSYESLNSRKRRTFYTTSYLQGQWKYGEAKEAVESARAGLLPQEESVRKLRKEKKTQGRGEGGSSEGNVPCVLNQEFLFFGSRVSGFRSDPSWLKYRLLRDLVYKKPCAKAVPEMDSLMQQKQYHKRTTLRTTKLPLRSIRSKEGPHYRLSKAQESCYLTSNECHIWHGYVEDPTAKYS